MVEVMVALLLTAVAVMGILGLYLAELRSSAYTRHSSEAVLLAQDKLEQLRTQVAAAATGSEAGIDERGQTPGMFTRRWTVALGTGVADVSVTVSWSEDGVARQFVLRGKRTP